MRPDELGAQCLGAKVVPGRGPASLSPHSPAHAAIRGTLGGGRGFILHALTCKSLSSFQDGRLILHQGGWMLPQLRSTDRGKC